MIKSPPPRQRRKPRLGVMRLVLAVGLGVAGVAGSAVADEVVRGGNTFANVTVRGIEDGHLVYRAGAGDIKAPLDEIQVLNLDNEPRLSEAMAAFNAGRMRSAEGTLSDIFGQAQVPWVKQFVGYYFAQALDQRGKPVEAAQVYVYLAASGADPYLLGKPPVGALAEADDDEKSRIRDEVMAIIGDTKGKTRDRLQAYLRRVVGDEAMPELEPTAQDAQSQARAQARGDSAVILPDPIWKLVENIGRNEPNADRWDAIKLLAQGKNQDALETLGPWLDNPADLPEKLYLLGRIQLALADQSKAPEMYKDAGLTFMRLYAHFGPPAGRSSHPLVYPARLELAYIHQQIDRQDLYKTLIEGVYGLIDDPEAYPEYHKRYYQIIGEEPPAVEQNQPE